MATKIANIGLDVGNHDTKTPNSVTNSGFSKFPKIPFAADEALFYNGSWYVPDVERFPYRRDKTTDDKCFILSLFGIAKEIVTKASNTCATEEEIKERVESIGYINLGVGLPPAHMITLKEKTIEYYTTYFGNGIEFTYVAKDIEGVVPGRYDFNLKLNCVEVFPQDLSAAMVAPDILKRTKDDTFITKKYKLSGYYAIDIGGYTVDVVPIINGKPRVADCISLEYGVLRLYGEVVKIINQEYGISLSNEIIEHVLKNEATALNQKVIDRIYDVTTEWVTRIINEIRKMGLEFNATPVLFLGGGSKLLKKYINTNAIIKDCEHSFVTDPKANAIGYKKYLATVLRNAS
jgi:plasmid segregation protein ParM